MTMRVGVAGGSVSVLGGLADGRCECDDCGMVMPTEPDPRVRDAAALSLSTAMSPKLEGKTDSLVPCSFRYDVLPADRDAVRAIVESTGFFHAAEVAVAVELVEERLAKGPASGYHFVFAERDGRSGGYACYGHIAGTAASYDLYWIAVEASLQRIGLGRVLMAEAERLVRAAGGKRIYVETSNRAQYVPTRRFYERCGYRLEAVLKDFYAPGDDKAIFVKVW